MKKDEGIKKYQEYKQETPLQMVLFHNDIGSERKYSNTIELYDTLPKYFYGNPEREKGKKGEYLPILERKFQHKGTEYHINISPAGIINKEGKTIHYYPSQREELIEDVLRKLACEGRGVFLDEEMGFSFSLYEVQQELQKNGHGYNLNEIKNALKICARCNIEIFSEDKTLSINSAIFTTLGLKGVDNHTQTFVRFSPLVTKSIKGKTFRQLNYPKYMTHKKMLSRWLHKRLSHYFVQASKSNSYVIKLTTIVTSSGMNFHKQLTNTRSQVITVLKELVKNQVLEKYDFVNIREGKRKNQITDVKFHLFPHETFIRDIIKSNLKDIKIQKFNSKKCE